MRTLTVLALMLLVLAGWSACRDTAEEAPGEAAAPTGEFPDRVSELPDQDSAQPCSSLVGSWELVSIAEDAPALTQEFELDPAYQEAPTLKILNGTHWMFIRQSSQQFIHAQGGRYTLGPNGTYTEIVEYSAIPQNLGVNYTFECRMQGDSLWYHIGGLGDHRYDEVWRRVR